MNFIILKFYFNKTFFKRALRKLRMEHVRCEIRLWLKQLLPKTFTLCSTFSCSNLLPFSAWLLLKDFVSASCLFILISYSTLNPLQYGFSPHYSTATILANFVMTSFLLHLVGVFQSSSLSLNTSDPVDHSFSYTHALSIEFVIFHSPGFPLIPLVTFFVLFLGFSSSAHLLCTDTIQASMQNSLPLLLQNEVRGSFNSK